MSSALLYQRTTSPVLLRCARPPIKVVSGWSLRGDVVSVARRERQVPTIPPPRSRWVPSAAPITSSKGALSTATLTGLLCQRGHIEEVRDERHRHRWQPGGTFGLAFLAELDAGIEVPSDQHDAVPGGQHRLSACLEIVSGIHDQGGAVRLGDAPAVALDAQEPALSLGERANALCMKRLSLTRASSERLAFPAD